MQFLGAIVRLQIQRSSLKAGLRGRRWYDPSPLQSVREIQVAPDGVVFSGGPDGDVMDIHHRDHSASKQSRGGENAVSIGFTSHYRTMRDRFGEHLSDGIAGENILVETDRTVSEDDLSLGLVITLQNGQNVRLESVIVAEPCVEFTRFAIHYPPDAPADGTLTEALSSLREGVRGFYARYGGEPVSVRPGDRVFLPGD
jgi:hypothetical protein